MCEACIAKVLLLGGEVFAKKDGFRSMAVLTTIIADKEVRLVAQGDGVDDAAHRLLEYEREKRFQAEKGKTQ